MPNITTNHATQIINKKQREKKGGRKCNNGRHATIMSRFAVFIMFYLLHP